MEWRQGYQYTNGGVHPYFLLVLLDFQKNLKKFFFVKLHTVDFTLEWQITSIPIQLGKLEGYYS